MENCGTEMDRLLRYSYFMVGATGIEPATPCTPCKYSTRLSYAPTTRGILNQLLYNYKYFFESRDKSPSDSRAPRNSKNYVGGVEGVDCEYNEQDGVDPWRVRAEAFASIYPTVFHAPPSGNLKGIIATVMKKNACPRGDGVNTEHRNAVAGHKNSNPIFNFHLAYKGSPPVRQ